jgi:hypothetical protein
VKKKRRSTIRNYWQRQLDQVAALESLGPPVEPPPKTAARVEKAALPTRRKFRFKREPGDPS